MEFDAEAIAGNEKVYVPGPSWVEGDNGYLSLVAPLEIEGVTIEGLVLRATAYKDLPDEAVMFQVEFPHDRNRRDNAIQRIDWRPLHIHNNHGKGPPQYRLQLINGTHHHSFELNWLVPERRLRKTNLPVAEPISPDIQDFTALLDFVAESFRIKKLDAVRAPPWERDLL